ncbi:MAG TPA: hypothetical protein P5184_05065 [Bacteroidales bacterium]|nr:hypothetical protein [Bacteroidales bacterium]
MKKYLKFVVLGLLVSLVLASCASPAVEVALLKITSGTTVSELSKSDIEAYEEITVDYTNKDGETTTYNGYALKDILTDVSDASVITFTAVDGYSADMNGVDLLACDDCILAFQDDGTLRLVMPNQSSKLSVKDLVEISVK